MPIDLRERPRAENDPPMATGPAAVSGRLPLLVSGAFRLASGAFPVSALVGVLTFLVYLRTLSVSIAWGDSPELTSAAFYAGVPHPTGYPLYMLLAHAFLRAFCWGTVAFRMNLLSAISAALAMALLYPVMLRLSRSRPASMATTLLFAFSQTYWSQAVIAEVYAFHMLGMTAVLGCVLAWDTRGERRWLGTAALVYGLCLTHHLMSLLLFPGLLFYALTSRHRGQFLRELRWTLPLFLLPLSLYAYLPLAALRDTPLNWGDPRTWDNFLAHLTGRQYHQAMFHMTRAELWEQFSDYAALRLTGREGLLVQQYTLGFLWLAPVGAWSLLRRRRRLLGLTLHIYLVDLIYALNYNIFDVEIYYLPSHLMVAVWIGCGLRQVGVWLGLLWRRIELAPARRRPLNLALGSGLLVMPLTLLWANWWVNDHHNDWSALMYARAVLETLKPNALLLGGGDNTYFPLLYTRYVEHRRPDVTMLNLYDLVMRPELMATQLVRHGELTALPDRRRQAGESVGNSVARLLVERSIDQRPVYVVLSRRGLLDPRLTRQIGGFYRISDSNLPNLELVRHPPQPERLSALPRSRGRAASFSCGPPWSTRPDVELLGWEVRRLPADGVPLLRIRYYWRANDLAAARSAKVWVLFTDASGNYAHETDGTPKFHNIHPLGSNLGLGSGRAPQTFQETFTLYVPPSAWNQRLRVRIAVARGERFLTADSGDQRWVETGALPLISGEDGLRRVASAQPHGPGQ